MKKLFLVDKLSFVNRESRRDWVDLILTYDFQRAIESAERNFGDFTCTESRAFQDDISSAHLIPFILDLSDSYPRMNCWPFERQPSFILFPFLAAFLPLTSTRRANFKIDDIKRFKEEFKNWMNYEDYNYIKKTWHMI